MTPPTDPETTMPDDKTPAPEAPAPRNPALDPWLARMDRVVDVIAILVLGYICTTGRLSGEITAGAIVAVAGVQTGLRQINAARGAPAVGAIGALLLAVGFGAVAHGPAVADAARTLGQRGVVRGHLLLALGGAAGVALCALHPLATLAVVGALVALYVLSRPRRPQPRAAERGSARPSALLVVVVLLWAGLAVELQGCPRLPPPDGCTPAAWRCAGDRPERCSPGRRWTPVGDLPCGATGLVCVELADRARCAAGGAR